jgi:hypothetical protein
MGIGIGRVGFVGTVFTWILVACCLIAYVLLCTVLTTIFRWYSLELERLIYGRWSFFIPAYERVNISINQVQHRSASTFATIVLTVIEIGTRVFFVEWEPRTSRAAPTMTMLLLCLMATGHRMIVLLWVMPFRNNRSKAMDPVTAAKTLKKLSRSLDGTTAKLVASNPNTPIDVLWELVVFYPYEVINNPLFPLIALGNPNWILEISENSLLKILNRPNIPKIFVREALKHQAYQVEIFIADVITADRSSPSALLEELVLSHNMLYEKVLHHPNLTVESLKRFATYGNRAMQEKLGRYCGTLATSNARSIHLNSIHQQMAIEISTALVNNIQDNEDLRFNFLETTGFPPQHTQLLIDGLDREQKLNLVKYWQVPSHVLDCLAAIRIADTNWQIRIYQAIAKHRNISEALLEKLANSEYKAVRASVAQNRYLPLFLIVKLAIDPHKQVRKNLVANCYIEAGLLKPLLHHPNPEIRRLAAQHPNTPNSAP